MIRQEKTDMKKGLLLIHENGNVGVALADLLRGEVYDVEKLRVSDHGAETALP